MVIGNCTKCGVYTDIWAGMAEGRERVTAPEEGVERLEERFPAEEVVTELRICVGNLPRDPRRPDGVLAGDLVAALDVGLSRRIVEKTQSIFKKLNNDGSVKSVS